MFSRALLVALCVVYATSLTPLTPLAPLTATADDDCALYLTGPGRSSAYDYSLNLLKGNFAYDGQHTCITYEAINQAYLDARNRILVSQPKGDWKAEDFASVGELILDISISLARTYGLTYEEIEKGLPLIDTSRTLIREACPPVFSHVECRAGKYRRLDGLCNNLKHPTWGATMAPFQRLIGPLFSDGINAPRISHTGHDLPLSRVVSRTMHPDDGFHDHAGTVMVIAWGQFMDHDYTLTGTPLDPVHRNDPEECCKRPPHLKHPYCNEIRIPDDDYFYRLFGVKCIDFVRGFPSPRPGCRLGSRVPFNTLTGALDGNTVYGVTEKFARKLRTGYGGLLRMNPVFKEYGLKDLLPLKLDIPDEGCTRPNKNMYCFEAGEIRVNEQLVLTVMHTLMAREHNRVAEALAHVNPHWDDESLFQEARRINIAEIQHITYNEFLPILLGKDVMEKFGLVLAKEGYWEGYDEEVNPDVIASFAAAAYRFGHSLLPTAVERWSKAHKFIASKRLSDLIRRPYDLYRAGVLDEYVMGLMNQVAQAMDDSITQEVTNHLFKKVGARFGMDLVSFNMQRGREFGLPGYMEFRKFCGLSGADTFQDLFGSMPNETIRKYESIFEHPVDVDLWSGGVSERPLPGSMLGPTFACIIATQFSYSRRGDRFWFELPNQPSSFTPEQLAEIRKSRLARIICDNTDIIDTVQLYPMVLPDHELNPRVPCRSGIIPSMDFSKWADPVPFLGGAKEYMTDAYNFNGTATHNNQTDRICNNMNGTCASNKTSNADSLDNLNNFTVSSNSTVKDLLCSYRENNTHCTNEAFDQSKSIFKQIEVNTTSKTDYKKSDELKGHFKNSLKRKRRSFNRNNDDDGDDDDKTVIPRVYDVIKDQNIERDELNLPKFSPSDIIKSSDLPDFKVPASHKSDKPDHNQFQRKEQRYPSPINNDQYFARGRSTNKQNKSYQQNKREFNPTTQKERYYDKINNEHYLPKTREITEESAEINVRQNPNIENSSYEDERGDISDNNNNKNEREHHNKVPTNILPRGNLRYHKEKKNKYHISKAKKINDESKENNNKNNASFEEDDEDDDDDVQDERFEDDDTATNKPKSTQGRKEEYNEDIIKQKGKDNFSYEEDEEPDTDFIRNKNIHGHKLLPNNSLHGNNEKYNDNHKNPSHTSKKPDEYNDEYDETEDDYKDDVDEKEPLKEFKSGSSFQTHKPSDDAILERHNQEYNDKRNKHFATVLKKEDDNNDDNYDDDDEDDDEDSIEHSKNNSKIDSHKQPPHNISPKQNELYNNKNENNKYYSPEHKNLDESNERQDTYNNHYQNKENVDQPIENDSGIHENKQISNKIQRQHELYNVDKNKYPVLNSKNRDDQSDENYETQGKSKESEYEEDIKDFPKKYSKNEELPTNTAAVPLHSYKTADFRKERKEHESKENEGDLNYTIQPVPGNYGVSRNGPEIRFKSNIDNGKPHILSADRSVFDKNTKFNSKENFSDSKIKHSQLLQDNYKNSPNIAKEAFDKSKASKEIDLSDFSYDKFRGLPIVETYAPVKISHQNYEADSLIQPTVRPKINKKLKNKTANNRKPKVNKQVLNRGVAKSVIESNNENSSEESNENSNEKLTGNLNSIVPSHGNHRRINPNKTIRKPKVKKQFQTKPLNQADSNASKKDSLTNSESEGTLDILSPKTNKYDEHLKIKFDDINIKLPEIKLPQNILSYAQEVPDTNNDKVKNNYYNQQNHDLAQYKQNPNPQGETGNSYRHYDPTATTVYSQQPKAKGDKPAEEYDFFASYINKPNEEIKTDEDTSNSDIEDGEDLYERFVRERFGRKDSFKERTEKLQEKKAQENKSTTKNKELFDNIQKAIKKAEEVQQEAEKSKDPKANYLWTLEYGEKV